MSIPFKPRHSMMREYLKDFKSDFDNSERDSHELLTDWAITYGPPEALKAYQGEFLHQLALRSERRGDIKRAERFFGMSEQALSGNALGLARTLRDHGLMIVSNGENPHGGLAMIEKALQLHNQDINNAKGRRQRLITKSKLWRAQIIMGDNEATMAKQSLIDLVHGPDFTFCIRDKKVIIDFLIPRTRGPLRREMLLRQAAIYAERRQPRHVVETGVKLAIDIELSLLGTLIRKIFRRE